MILWFLNFDLVHVYSPFHECDFVPHVHARLKNASRKQFFQWIILRHNFFEKIILPKKCNKKCVWIVFKSTIKWFFLKICLETFIRLKLFYKFTSGNRWKKAIPMNIPPLKAFAIPKNFVLFLQTLQNNGKNPKRRVIKQIPTI